LGQHSSGSTAYFENGQLVIKAAADDDRVVGHPAPLFRDASLCVRVISPPAQEDLFDAGAVAVFWASDTTSSHPDRGFTAAIVPGGGYFVTRKSGNSEYDIVKDKQFAGIKTGLSAINLIKIVARTSGNAVYFNGVKGQDFNSMPDDQTRYIGFFAESEKAQVNEWRFLDIVMVAPNFVDELTDFGIPPQNTLHFPVDSETPTTIPGAVTLRTGELHDAIQKTTLDGAKFLMFDVLSGDHATIVGAERLAYAGGGTGFTDDTQRRLSKDLKTAAKNNLALPIVFFCEGAVCWESYNAALRAERIGFTKIYWYRGGIYAWKAAGLPMK
jgi:rhodanese-related sulfurtransferase